MIYALTVILIILYLYGLYKWNKKVTWRLNPRFSKIIKYLHFITITICFTIGISYYNYDIGLRGLWTTRILIIAALLTGEFFIFLSNKTIINKIEIFYFKLFSFLPVMFLGILLIPFIGVVIMASLFGQLISPAEMIYYQDTHIRIQSSFIGVLTSPKLYVFKKMYIFEKYIYRSDIYSGDFDSVKVNYDKDSIRVSLYKIKNLNEPRIKINISINKN